MFAILKYAQNFYCTYLHEQMCNYGIQQFCLTFLWDGEGDGLHSMGFRILVLPC